MSLLTDLEDIRDSIVARLKECLASVSPSITVDGQSVDRNAYQDMLLRQLKAITEQIADVDVWEVRSIHY